MSIEYKMLAKEDTEELNLFIDSSEYTDILKSLIRKNFLVNNFFKISAEFVDKKINGIMVACSYGTVCNCPEVLPIWVGLRIDRKNAVSSFTEFLDKTSIFMTDHFEGLGYYQHYIVRRMPKRSLSIDKLSEITKKGWAQGHYTTIVEREVRSLDEYNNLPIFFKMIIGRYKDPVCVLCMYLPNEFRKF